MMDNEHEILGVPSPPKRGPRSVYEKGVYDVALCEKCRGSGVIKTHERDGLRITDVIFNNMPELTECDWCDGNGTIINYE